MTTFTCPKCRRTSCHPEDARQGYCGACHEFTGQPAAVSAADIVDEIDAVLACVRCGRSLGDSPSPDFCGETCQSLWHARRARVPGRVAVMDPAGDVVFVPLVRFNIAFDVDGLRRAFERLQAGFEAARLSFGMMAHELDDDAADE